MMHAELPTMFRQVERNGAAEAKRRSGDERGRGILWFNHDACVLWVGLSAGGSPPTILLGFRLANRPI